MSEPDNLILVHLRELRSHIDARFAAIEQRLDIMDKRIDGMHRNGMTALKQFIGFRAMTERTIASLDSDLKTATARLDSLESAAT